jgi:hypothetical protein
MISANLNAPTMMMADKASDLIRGRTAPEVVGSIAGYGHGIISAPLRHADGP